MPFTTLIDCVITTLSTDADALETVHDVEVRVNNNIAMLWAPFRTTQDDVLQGEGTNIVTLAKIDVRWLISRLVDTASVAKGREPLECSKRN